MVEIDKGAGVEIVGAHLDDGLGDLLSVGSDILDGSSAYVAGNARETLDDRRSRDRPRRGRQRPSFLPLLLRGQRCSLHCTLLFGPGTPTRITTPSKPASLTSRLLPPPRTKRGRLRSLGELGAFKNVAFGLCLTEEARRPTDPKRRVRGKRD